MLLPVFLPQKLCLFQNIFVSLHQNLHKEWRFCPPTDLDRQSIGLYYKKPLIHYESAVYYFSRGDRTRTCDSLVPNQERYQLRYTSKNFAGAKVQNSSDTRKYFERKLLDNSLLNEDFLQSGNRTVNLLLGVGGHQRITHQSILRSTSGRNDRVNEYASLEGKCRD